MRPQGEFGHVNKAVGMAISPGFGAGGMPRSVLVVVLAVSVFCSGVAGVREPLDSAGSEDVRGAAEVWGSRGEIGRSREAGLRTVDSGVYVEGDAGAENVDSNAELSVHGFRVRRARSVDDSRNALERPAAPVRRIEAGGDSVDATGDAFGRQNAGVIETIHLIRGRFLLGGASPPPDNVWHPGRVLFHLASVALFLEVISLREKFFTNTRDCHSV